MSVVIVLVNSHDKEILNLDPSLSRQEQQHWHSMTSVSVSVSLIISQRERFPDPEHDVRAGLLHAQHAGGVREAPPVLRLHPGLDVRHAPRRRRAQGGRGVHIRHLRRMRHLHHQHLQERALPDETFKLTSVTNSALHM